MAHDVFISYSSKDKPTADAACALLEGAGVRCWVAPRDIMPGRDWGESIIDAIAASRVMVLIFSEHANQSPQVRREVERAVNKSVVIVPFRIENVPVSKSLEYFISVPHWMDAYSGGPIEAHLARLCQTVKALIHTAEPSAATGGPAAAADPGRRASEPMAAGQSKPQSGGRTGRKVALAAVLAAAVVAGAGVMSGRITWHLPNRAAAEAGGGQPAAGHATDRSDGAVTPVETNRGESTAAPATRPAATEAPPAAPARVTLAPPPAEAPKKAPDSPASEAAALRLTSVAVVGRSRSCVIDGKTAREGDVVRGFTVWQILTDRVVVVRDGRRFELRPQPAPAETNYGPQGREPMGDDPGGPGGPGGASRYPGGPGGGDGPRGGIDPFGPGYGDGPPPSQQGPGGPPPRRGRGGR